MTIDDVLSAIKPLLGGYGSWFFIVGLIVLFAMAFIAWAIRDIQDYIHWINGPEGMQAIISIVLLIAGLYVILSKAYDPSTTNWAFATIGTLVGFWLRPVRGKSSSRRPANPK